MDPASAMLVDVIHALTRAKCVTCIGFKRKLGRTWVHGGTCNAFLGDFVPKIFLFNLDFNLDNVLMINGVN